MNALPVELHDRTPPALLPVFTRLLPGLVSALALAPAALAFELPYVTGRVLVPLLWVQAWLLAAGAMSLVATAHERLSPWEGRVAPTAARSRVRWQLLRDLGWMGGIGVAGPLVLGAVLDWQAQQLRTAAGVVALLSAALACGAVSALCWKGRAPRVLLLPAAAVMGALSWAPVVAAVGRGPLLQSLAIVVGAGLPWVWLLSPGALAAHGRPWPRFEPLSWWRRRWAHRLWRSVPYRFGPNQTKRYGGAFWAVWLLFAQSHSYAGRVEWLSWGQAYTHVHAVLGYAAWLLFLGLLAASALIAPPVHWRQRLAPGGLSARRWARRLVLGSMLACVAMLSAALMLAALVNKHPFWPLDASAWASALGDLLLVFSLAACWRGQRNRNTDILWFVAALAVAVPSVLGLLLASGLTPQRGPVWLLIQLMLTIPLTRAAIRAWAQQDMNLMA